MFNFLKATLVAINFCLKVLNLNKKIFIKLLALGNCCSRCFSFLSSSVVLRQADSRKGARIISAFIDIV